MYPLHDSYLYAKEIHHDCSINPCINLIQMLERRKPSWIRVLAGSLHFLFTEMIQNLFDESFILNSPFYIKLFLSWPICNYEILCSICIWLSVSYKEKEQKCQTWKYLISLSHSSTTVSKYFQQEFYAHMCLYCLWIDNIYILCSSYCHIYMCLCCTTYQIYHIFIRVPATAILHSTFEFRTFLENIQNINIRCLPWCSPSETIQSNNFQTIYSTWHSPLSSWIKKRRSQNFVINATWR